MIIHCPVTDVIGRAAAYEHALVAECGLRVDPQDKTDTNYVASYRDTFLRRAWPNDRYCPLCALATVTLKAAV